MSAKTTGIVPAILPARHPGVVLGAIVLATIAMGACQVPPPSTNTANPESGPSIAFSAPAQRAVASIDATRIRSTVEEIAADAYQGRAPASASDVMTRRYLSEQLAELGFAPGSADGQWEQAFELVGITAEQPRQWHFSKMADDADALALIQGEEFIAASAVQREHAAVNDAELVFVGFGIQAPEYQWDDFKGVDVSGKILLILNNDPDWDQDLFAGERRLYYGRWSYKYESAASQGALGAIVIHTTESAGYPWQVVQTSWSGEQFELPAGDEPRLQVAAWVTNDAAEKLSTLAGLKLQTLVAAAKRCDFQPVSMGIQTSLTLQNSLSKGSSANVLGLLRGSDPQINDELVVYTAHHDHLGVAPVDSENPEADRIYNGARDNASGVGQVLAIARAFSTLPVPPRRSILIAFVGAEEQGLLGSQFYARHPSVASGKLAANLNFDSANIWGETRDITYIGIGKSTLDEVVNRVAEYQDRYVTGDQHPDRGYFYRSDQFSLARIGVPALYLSGGTDFIGRSKQWGKQQTDVYTASHYHQPSDELSDEWNFDGIVRDAQFGFWAGWLIANAERMPSWNPGDEFEAARLRALAEIAQAQTQTQGSPN